VKKILAADLLICDIILPLSEHPQLAPLITQYNAAHPDHPITPGSKSPLSDAEFQEWQQAVAGQGSHVAGGSAANTLSALKQLMGEGLDIDFIGAYGNDMCGHIIAESLSHDGFHVVPEAEGSPDVKTAISFVMLDANGERSIVGFPGTGREKIRADYPPEDIAPDYDILFLPGSLLQKYGHDYAGALYAHAMRHKKLLWLSLPTHSRASGEHNHFIHSVVPHAHVVLANAEELKRMYATNDLERALAEIQLVLSKSQVAFITDGGRGAYVITHENVSHFHPAPIQSSKIRTTLGAGDASFAGFLYGWLEHLSHAESAEFAMKLAALKMQQDGARITGANLLLTQ